MADRRLTARQGDTLDLLLSRDAGLGPHHMTRILDANPGLADLGSILPLGTVIIIPATTQPATTRTLALTQLWD